MNRNVNVNWPYNTDTEPYGDRIRVRIRNAGWEKFFGADPVGQPAGSYSFTNGATYNFTPPATARVKGRWNRVGLFNTGTGASTALDPGWNDRFTCYYLPPQGDALPYSTTVPANGAAPGERGKAMYLNGTKTSNYNITTQNIFFK